MELLYDGPTSAAHSLVLAHGAGGAMDSPFMAAMASGLGGMGIRVVRFEFPYMARRRAGKGGPPDRAAVLTRTWHEVIEKLAGDALVIGGKSMGGRYATMIADRSSVAGVVCLGYPFHPPGKPGQLRVDHLRSMRTPCLIVQGERDPFGGPDEVASYGLPESIAVHWLADGDHSFKPRKSSKATERGNLAEAIRVVASFVSGL